MEAKNLVIVVTIIGLFVGFIFLTSNPIHSVTLQNGGAPIIQNIVNGTIGPMGPRGYNGTDGLQGIQGIQGMQGVQGIQGIMGYNGTNGVNGINGLNGTNGTNGLDGAFVNGTNAEINSLYANVLYFDVANKDVYLYRSNINQLSLGSGDSFGALTLSGRVDVSVPIYFHDTTLFTTQGDNSVLTWDSNGLRLISRGDYKGINLYIQGKNVFSIDSTGNTITCNSDVINMPYYNGDYGLTWSTSMPNPTGVVNGGEMIVYNSNSGILSSRLYIYTNGAWHYIAII